MTDPSEHNPLHIGYQQVEGYPSSFVAPPLSIVPIYPVPLPRPPMPSSEERIELLLGRVQVLQEKCDQSQRENKFLVEVLQSQVKLTGEIRNAQAKGDKEVALLREELGEMKREMEELERQNIELRRLVVEKKRLVEIGVSPEEDQREPLKEEELQEEVFSSKDDEDGSLSTKDGEDQGLSSKDGEEEGGEGCDVLVDDTTPREVLDDIFCPPPMRYSVPEEPWIAVEDLKGRRKGKSFCTQMNVDTQRERRRSLEEERKRQREAKKEEARLLAKREEELRVREIERQAADALVALQDEKEVISDKEDRSSASIVAAKPKREPKRHVRSKKHKKPSKRLPPPKPSSPTDVMQEVRCQRAFIQRTEKDFSERNAALGPFFWIVSEIISPSKMEESSSCVVVKGKTIALRKYPTDRYQALMLAMLFSQEDYHRMLEELESSQEGRRGIENWRSYRLHYNMLHIAVYATCLKALDDKIHLLHLLDSYPNLMLKSIRDKKVEGDCYFAFSDAVKSLPIHSAIFFADYRVVEMFLSWPREWRFIAGQLDREVQLLESKGSGEEALPSLISYCRSFCSTFSDLYLQGRSNERIIGQLHLICKCVEGAKETQEHYLLHGHEREEIWATKRALFGDDILNHPVFGNIIRYIQAFFLNEKGYFLMSDFLQFFRISADMSIRSIRCFEDPVKAMMIALLINDGENFRRKCQQVKEELLEVSCDRGCLPSVTHVLGLDTEEDHSILDLAMEMAATDLEMWGHTIQVIMENFPFLALKSHRAEKTEYMVTLEGEVEKTINLLDHSIPLHRAIIFGGFSLVQELLENKEHCLSQLDWARPDCLEEISKAEDLVRVVKASSIKEKDQEISVKGEADPDVIAINDKLKVLEEIEEFIRQRRESLDE